MGGNGRDPEQRKALQNNTNRWRSGLSGTPEKWFESRWGYFIAPYYHQEFFVTF
jgi:hypothetical protein